MSILTNSTIKTVIIVLLILILPTIFIFRKPLRKSIRKLIPKAPQAILKEPPTEEGIKILFLHHSTGLRVWNGGIPKLFEEYRKTHNKNYFIVEQKFPKEGGNYPYDYWNIWVNHAAEIPYMNDPTLEMILKKYDVVIWKHCFPLSSVEKDIDEPAVDSNIMCLANYKLQYEALKNKMNEFPNKKFIVWTGAVRVKEATTEEKAKRGRLFYEWIKNEWDKPDDNIFIWDFYDLETEGGIYLKEEYASGPKDSHPNKKFSQKAAKLLFQKIIDVIELNDNTKNAENEAKPKL